MGSSSKYLSAARQKSSSNIVSLRGMFGGGTLASMAGSMGGFSGLSVLGGTSAAHSDEQLAHFQGCVYSVVNTIINRSSDSALKVADMSANMPDDRRMSDAYIKKFVPKTMKDLARNASVLDKHRILDVFENPNPIMTKYHLTTATYGGLEMNGKAFWYLRPREETETGQDEIWPFPASWWEPIHKEDRLFAAWWLMIPGMERKEIPGNRVAYFYRLNLKNPLESFSPLQAMANSVLADEYIEASQKATFRNSPNPSVALMVGRMPGSEGLKDAGAALLTKEQRNQMIAAVMGQYSGVVNDGRPLILDDFIKDIKRINPSIREMDFLQSGQATQDRIAKGWGVNPISMGQVEGANRASSAVADDHLLSNVINPKLGMVSEVLTRSVGPVFSDPNEKLLVFFERGQSHDADYELNLETSMVDRGAMSRNEWRHAHNKPPIQQGDSAFVGGIEIPIIRDEVEVAKNDNPEWAPPRINVHKSFRGMKSIASTVSTRVLIYTIHRRMGTMELEFQRSLRNYFIEMGQKIRVVIAPSIQHGHGAATSLIDQVCGHDFVMGLKKIAEPHLRELAIAGAVCEWELHIPRKSFNVHEKGWSDLFKLPGRVLNAVDGFVSKLLGLDSWVKVMDTVKNDLKTGIEKATETGAGLQLADDIIHEYLGIGSSATRAARISSTESLGAFGGGQHQSRTELGNMGAIKVKSWADYGDNKVRPAHHKANTQTVGVNDHFIVGGEKCMFPGDPSLSIGNRINCRCIAISGWLKD